MQICERLLYICKHDTVQTIDYLHILLQYSFILLRFSREKRVSEIIKTIDNLMPKSPGGEFQVISAMYNILLGTYNYFLRNYESALNFYENGLINFSEVPPSRFFIEGMAISAIILEREDNGELALTRLIWPLDRVKKNYRANALEMFILCHMFDVTACLSFGSGQGLIQCNKIVSRIFSLSEKLRYQSPLSSAYEGDLEKLLDRFYEQTFMSYFILGNIEASYLFMELTKSPLLRKSITFRIKSDSHFLSLKEKLITYYREKAAIYFEAGKSPGILDSEEVRLPPRMRHASHEPLSGIGQ